jgi:hypothetical protein
MAGLLDDLDPGLLSLLGGGANEKGTGLGLLRMAGGGDLGGGGLLGAWRGPKPDEDFSTRLFGNPSDPSDPRGRAMMALSAGLLRGSFADGVEGFNKAFTDTEDRNGKRALNNLLFGKSALEISEMQRKLKDDADTRGVLQDFYRTSGANGSAAPGSSPNFRLPTLDADAPMPGQFAPLPGGVGVAPPMNYMGEANGEKAGYGGYGGGTTRGVARPRASVFDQYSQLGDAFAAKGLGTKAQQYYELAEKYRPKFNTTPQFMTGPGGKLVPVLVGEDGTTQELGYGPKPDIAFEDLGDRKEAVDRNQVRAGTSYAKAMTPGEVASNRVAQDRLAMDRDAPQYMQTDGGLVALPKRPGPGPIVGAPVMGEDGQPFGGGPKLTEFQGKSTTYATRMQDAAKVIEGLEGKVWPSTVARAGYKAEFPEWAPGGQVVGAAISGINRATVPEGAQQYRQAQENWVTANLRQESGAAIGKDEMEKDIAKWFPQPGDGEATIRQKADARRVAEQAMLAQAGPGAKIVSRTLDRAEQQRRERGDEGKTSPGMPSLPPANASNRGRKIRDNQTGRILQSDGFQWKEVR